MKDQKVINVIQKQIQNYIKMNVKIMIANSRDDSKSLNSSVKY